PLLYDGGGDIRAARVHVERTRARNDDEIHVLHGDRTQKDLSPYHQGAHEAHPIAKSDLDRAYVRNESAAVIREGRFLPAGLLELQLDLDVLGYAEVKRPGIRERRDGDRGEVR